MITLPPAHHHSALPPTHHHSASFCHYTSATHRSLYQHQRPITTQHHAACPTVSATHCSLYQHQRLQLTYQTASFSLSHSTAKASSYQHQQPPPLTDSPHSIVLLVPLHSKGLLARQHMTVKAAMRVLEACDGGACGRWHCFYGACCLHCT